jgi:beta-glucosidase
MWGTASSALQCEGAAPASDWARWERTGRVPSSGDGNGFRSRGLEDVELLAQHGVGAHRLTIEWARLEPRPGEWDTAEVDRYSGVLRALREQRVEAWVTLHHLTLPGWFSEDERGFRDERMARRVWPAHVDRVAETFGDLVDGWIPINQPTAYAAHTWSDEDDRATGLANLRRANREAARLLGSGPAPVITSHSPGEPGDELKLDAEVFGGFGLVHPATEGSEARAALQRLIDDAGDVPVWVTAVGVGSRDPDEQADKARATAAQLDDARRDGIDVRGAFWWTAIDGYEPATAFEVPWGAFDRDRNARPVVEVLFGSAVRSGA